jgi:hypothetical protein
MDAGNMTPLAETPKGLAAGKLRHALKTVPEGTGQVLVEHVAGNTRATRFYEREGFVVVGKEAARSGDPNAAVVWRRLEL